MSKVKDVSIQIRGVSYKPKDLHNTLNDNSVILLRANNITDDSLNLDDVIYVDKSKVSKSQYLVKGDILVCASSGSKNLVGKATFIKNDIVATFGAFCKVVRPQKIFPAFLGYYFTSPKYRNTISQLSAGANINNIKNEHIDSLNINIPDIEQQQQIAENLDKVTRLIDLCNTILEKLDLLVKARFVEMFGDPVDNPMNWDKKTLAEECDIITGSTPSRKISNYYGDFIEWIKSDNINTTNAILTKAEEYLSEEGLKVGRSVESGSILMTCIAGSIGCIGNVAIANRKVSFNQQINGIVPNNNNTWYLYVMFELSKKKIQNSINMSLKGILSKGQLSEMKFIFPPIELQNQFADFAEKTEKSKSAVKQVLEKAETLKKALMQEYFG